MGVGTVHSQIDARGHRLCGVCTRVCAGQVMVAISIIMPQTAERSTRNLQTVITASTTHRPNVGPTLADVIDGGPTLGRCVVFAGMTVPSCKY